MSNPAPASPPHPNVLRYLRSIDAFNKNDVTTALESTDENVTFTIPGRSPVAGVFRGIPAYHAALRHVRDRSNNTLALKPDAVLANDDYLIVYGQVHAERNGKILDGPHCVMFRFADEKIVECRTIPVDQYAFDAFWE